MKMKLKKGKKYWCGWASRYAVYIGAINRRNWETGETEVVHRFRDICDAIIECEDKHIDKWVKETI